MVFFSCDGCGDSFKKNQVEKHRQRCKMSQNITCIDCQKAFSGNDYNSHTSCISESEKYGGKNYKPKPNENKGGLKQNVWTEEIRKAITTENLEPNIKIILQKVAELPNTPRKEKKFGNFLANLGYKEKKTVDEVWAVLQRIQKKQWAEQKPNSPTKGNKEINKVQVSSGETKVQTDVAINKMPSEGVAEKKRNKKNKKKKGQIQSSDTSNTTEHLKNTSIIDTTISSSKVLTSSEERSGGESPKKKKRNRKRKNKQPGNAIDVSTSSVGETPAKKIKAEGVTVTPVGAQNNTAAAVAKKKKKRKRKNKKQADPNTSSQTTPNIKGSLNNSASNDLEVTGNNANISLKSKAKKRKQSLIGEDDTMKVNGKTKKLEMGVAMQKSMSQGKSPGKTFSPGIATQKPRVSGILSAKKVASGTPTQSPGWISPGKKFKKAVNKFKVDSV